MSHTRYPRPCIKLPGLHCNPLAMWPAMPSTMLLPGQGAKDAAAAAVAAAEHQSLCTPVCAPVSRNLCAIPTALAYTTHPHYGHHTDAVTQGQPRPTATQGRSSCITQPLAVADALPTHQTHTPPRDKATAVQVSTSWALPKRHVIHVAVHTPHPSQCRNRPAAASWKQNSQQVPPACMNQNLEYHAPPPPPLLVAAPATLQRLRCWCHCWDCTSRGKNTVHCVECTAWLSLPLQTAYRGTATG